MTYDISLSEDKTFVRIKVLDVINGEIEINLAQHAIKEAGKYRIRKYLVDVRGVVNTASSLEHYRFGYEDMKAFGLDPRSRIAIVVDRNDASHNFIETIFLNVGYQCRLFTDETDALKWFEE